MIDTDKLKEVDEDEDKDEVAETKETITTKNEKMQQEKK
jgi:hypothetical protein